MGNDHLPAPVTVTALFRYPVKSLQGEAVPTLDVTDTGVTGDRRYGLTVPAGDLVLSAKRTGALLTGAARTEPDGRVLVDVPGQGTFGADDAALEAALTRWLGRPVACTEVSATIAVSYEMTLDPPNDDAEVFAIPAPRGSFVDLAAVHLVAEDTLASCRSARPDLDWDVRRFRPNVVIDGLGHAFAEDDWTGRRLALGSAVLFARQPTVRCALPLRAQPGLDRRPELYQALEDIHANHLGLYLDVVEPGTIAVGDELRVLD